MNWTKPDRRNTSVEYTISLVQNTHIQPKHMASLLISFSSQILRQSQCCQSSISCDYFRMHVALQLFSGDPSSYNIFGVPSTSHLMFCQFHLYTIGHSLGIGYDLNDISFVQRVSLRLISVRKDISVLSELKNSLMPTLELILIIFSLITLMCGIKVVVYMSCCCFLLTFFLGQICKPF